MTDPTTAADLPPFVRAEIDRALAGAIDAVLERAADLDDMDVLDANVEMTSYLLERFNPHRLAVIGAMLALRLHRAKGTGGA